MLPKDFRGYLEYLEKRGKLLRVKKEVDPKHGIAAGIRKISDTNGPALLFENVKGYPGWRVVGGIYGTKELMALALETEPDEKKLTQRYLDCIDKRVKPKLVATGPVKEIIIKGDDVDLTRLPNPTYNEKDAGPYIIEAAGIAKHPVTKVQNVGIYRRMVLSKNSTAIETIPPQDHGMIIEAAEGLGRGGELAIVLGAPPELSIASQVKAPLGVDETEIAGAFRGEPLEMVKCETIDVEVPAHAEIIIEGVTIPGKRLLDGPFGEFRGEYVSWTNIAYAECFEVKITAITMRKDAIYQAMLSGMPMTENHWLRKWAIAAECYREVSRIVTYPEDIKGVNMPEGGALTKAVISIHKRTERQPKDIIYTLLSRRLNLWHVMVVDDDIDVYNPFDVERAGAVRVVPGRDVIILPVPPDTIPLYAKRWGIDATTPLEEREWAKKARPPGVEKVDYV